MTMPNERTRSLVWAGAFLIELARDKSLPVSIRRSAVVIARHFPTTSDINYMASASGLGMTTAAPEDLVEWLKDYPHGPLLDSTRLESPTDSEAPPSCRQSTR